MTEFQTGKIKLHMKDEVTWTRIHMSYGPQPEEVREKLQELHRKLNDLFDEYKDVIHT